MFGETRFSVQQADRYKFIQLKGKRESASPLVLLHGMFGGLSNFDPLIARIQEWPIFVPQIPVYSFDKARLKIPKLSEWLHGVLDDHNIERPILLGNSMGGHIALQYALSYPQNLRALVLTGSSGLFENDLGSSRPKRYNREYVKQRASLTFYDDLVDDTIIDEILEVLQSPAKLIRLLRIARSTHQHNLENELPKIPHPTLLVWGRNDVITPPEVAEQFQQKMPNATLKWIDRCGHAPMMERPREFAEYLQGFLSELTLSDQNNDRHHEEDYTHF